MEKERIDDLELNNLKIIQNKDYFCFGMDSVLLANFVESSSSKNVILDLCSGTGVIPLILSAKKKSDKIYAVELQSEMFSILKRNIELNNLTEKIIGINDDIKNSKNILQKVKEISKVENVDVISCNPPYKEVGTGIINKNNINYIARYEVKCVLEDIFKTSRDLLKEKGKLYLVHKPERLADLITLARKYNLEPKKIQFIYPTMNKKPSIVLMEYIKNGGNELNILPAIIEFNEDGSYTDKIYEIYGSIKR